MKNKYLIFCMTLSLFLALSGCKKNEILQEDIIYNQNLHNDDQVEETSNNNKNKSETSNEIMNNSSQPIDDNILENLNEQSNGQNSSNEQSDSSNENAYFLSTNTDFYEKIASNPIDQKYVFDDEADTLEILQSALKTCEAWNQQIDFTGSELERLLSKTNNDQLKKAISLWHEYYQEEVNQNRELYGNDGMILGSMYTVLSADVLVEKCKLTSLTLLSLEHELSSNISFAEDTSTTSYDYEYSFLPQFFCIEYSSDFQEILNSYALNEKNSDELEELIHETAIKIEEKFGHDFTEHANKYISFIHSLYTIESDISEYGNLCLILKENRLKMYAVELVNILYLMDGQ